MAAWERTRNLLCSFFDCSDSIVTLTLSRLMLTGDMYLQQENRRPPAAGAVEISFGVVDVVVSAIFAVVAVTVFVTSREETPCVPFRVWIFGFGFQCIGHLAWLYVNHNPQLQQHFRLANIIKHVEYGKDLAYFAWWLLGLSWLVKSNGYDKLALTSLTAIFLFFDLSLFLVVVVGFIITATLLCCLLPVIYISFIFSRD